jgi:hypothetical protein
LQCNFYYNFANITLFSFLPILFYPSVPPSGFPKYCGQYSCHREAMVFNSEKQNGFYLLITPKLFHVLSVSQKSFIILQIADKKVALELICTIMVTSSELCTQDTLNIYCKRTFLQSNGYSNSRVRVAQNLSIPS